MRTLIDFLDDFVYGPMNYIDRLEGLLKATYYRDSGHVFTMLRMGKGGKHSRHEVEKLLHSYGIAVYCRTFDATYHYFRVKKRQARWAEYLMLHAGVELSGPLFDERNSRYVAQHPAGWMPQPWSTQEEARQDNIKSTPATDQNETASSARPDDAWSALKKMVEWD